MRAVIAAVVFAAVVPVHASSTFPEFDDPVLKRGRFVWLGTCEACHASALSDAPQVKDTSAWTPRLRKGREALYQSALNGFAGPSGTEMPARGGNDSLSDVDVRAAVDYMIKLVTP